MRLIYIIGLLTVIGTGALWCGWYGMVRRRIAAMLAAVSILAGGVLLLLAVLPDYSFYGTTVIHNFAAGKNVALTFDDGPNISVTPKVLDILKEENVKASFFVIGKCVDSHPEITKRAYDEGHYIANHGYSHNNNLLYKSSDNFLNELKKTDLAIGNAIGVPNYCSHIFRFPNGFMSPSNKAKKKEAVKLLQNIDFNYIDWNCLNNDSVKKYSSSQLLNNLIKSSQNKDVLVILMHDTKDVSNSSIVLKDSIKYLKDKGYIFKNFYDIL